MSRAVLPEFSKMRRGSLVNIGSVLGLVGDEGSRGVLRVESGVTMLTKGHGVDHGMRTSRKLHLPFDRGNGIGEGTF